MDLKAQDYKVIGKIGEGAHGIVLRAFDAANKQYVALKKMLSKQEETISVSALREIKSLQHVNSPYVLKLLGILTGGSSLVLVLELMAGGLGTVIYDVEHPMTVPQYKAYARMALTGLLHLHQISIMHRDLKPANLLIGYDGVLKISDLGQARLTRGRPFSHQVGSRWYRAPELLYGSRRYTCAVDMWSMGCILAEMVNKSPLFPGESDIEQLAIVIKCLGTPSQESWPGLRNLPDFDKISFPAAKGKSWKSIIPDSPPAAVDLVKSLVVYNPAHRLSVEHALNHRFFAMEPKTLEDNEMSLPLSLRGRLSVTRRKDINLDNSIDQMTSEFQSMEPALEEVKINIRAVLTSSKCDMSYQTLLKEYSDMVLEPMPFCGYPTRVELINSIPDVVQVIPGTPNMLRSVHSSMSEHVALLVKQQKNPPKKKVPNFPSISRLESIGVRMPGRNERPKGIKIEQLPNTVEQSTVKSAYKWPPVNDLWKERGKKEPNHEEIQNTRGQSSLQLDDNNQSRMLARNKKDSTELSLKSSLKSNASSKSDSRNPTAKMQRDFLHKNIDLLFSELF